MKMKRTLLRIHETVINYQPYIAFVQIQAMGLTAPQGAQNESENQGYYNYHKERQGLISFHQGTQWIDIEISDWPENNKKTDVFEIAANLDTDGVVGFWLPNSDFPISDKIPEPSFQYQNESKYKESSFFVECNSWKFGENAAMKLRYFAKKNLTPKFKFSILVRPLVQRLEPVELAVKVKQNGRVLEERTWALIPGEEILEKDQIKSMKQVYDLFTDYGANNLAGNGNIMHPKQYLTLRGVEYILKNLIDKNDLKIGYVGSDTTENVRSLVRWLREANYIERISEIVIFYTTDWDRKFIDHIKFEKQLKGELPGNCEPKILELSEEVSVLQKEKPDCDILITTYVTPYVSDGASKTNFLNLVDATIGPSSYLLSVDPKTGPDSVRAMLNKQNINNDLIYKSDLLNLTHAKSPVGTDNESVEWSIWKKKRSEVHD
jgi:hypothetical protein